MFRDLEKLIIRKIKQVENGTSIKGLEINKWLERMRDVDEPSFDKLTQRYIKALPKKEQIKLAMA